MIIDVGFDVVYITLWNSIVVYEREEMLTLFREGLNMISNPKHFQMFQA
jgi:hypothetical protein